MNNKSNRVYLQLLSEKSINFILRDLNKDKQFTILEGSVRSTKTVTMLFKLLVMIVELPPGDILIGGVSLNTVYRNVLAPLFACLGRESYSYNKTTGELHIGTRKLIVIGGGKKGTADNISGLTVSGIYLDELTLLDKEFVEMAFTRMSISGAKLYATTNPKSPSHYIYKKLIDPLNATNKEITEVIHYTIEDNQTLSEEYKQMLKTSQSPLGYKRNILGLWVIAEGAVYENFDIDKMVCCYEDLPDMMYYIVGADYGTTNPTAFLLLGMGIDSRIYVIDELYLNKKGRTILQMVEQYKAWVEKCKIKFNMHKKIEGICLDPSANAFKNQFKYSGIRNIWNADNSVKDGIAFIGSIIGANKLIVCKHCKYTLDEIVGYSWDIKASERGDDKPIKVNDHCMDALRYGIYTYKAKINKQFKLYFRKTEFNNDNKGRRRA